VTTSWRHHWVETVLQRLFIYLPLVLLFNPVLGTVIWLIILARVMGYIIHLNYPVRFGWFTRVLSTPQSHRIHHSTSPEHMNKNFATILPLWDILFGTYHHPKEHEWPSTGVPGVTVTSLWQAIVLPFVSWRKMLRAAMKPLDSTNYMVEKPVIQLGEALVDATALYALAEEGKRPAAAGCGQEQ
jgi:sterol desaturase/sphingolipid hydroxylase (fatty acid hydroxylase superfamily)